MPKISATSSKGLFLTYFIKIVISSIASVMLFNSISSAIILKLDLDLSVAGYVSIAVCLLSSIIISIISISGFKNNFLLLSVISVVPFAIFVFINFLVNKSNSIYFIIKLALIFAVAIIVALIKSSRKRWINGYNKG